MLVLLSRTLALILRTWRWSGRVTYKKNENIAHVMQKYIMKTLKNKKKRISAYWKLLLWVYHLSCFSYSDFYEATLASDVDAGDYCQHPVFFSISNRIQLIPAINKYICSSFLQLSFHVSTALLRRRSYLPYLYAEVSLFLF